MTTEKITTDASVDRGACLQCGDDRDMMVRFTRWQICGRCTRANHRKVTRK